MLRNNHRAHACEPEPPLTSTGRARLGTHAGSPHARSRRFPDRSRCPRARNHPQPHHELMGAGTHETQETAAAMWWCTWAGVVQRLRKTETNRRRATRTPTTAAVALHAALALEAAATALETAALALQAAALALQAAALALDRDTRARGRRPHARRRGLRRGKPWSRLAVKLALPGRKELEPQLGQPQPGIRQPGHNLEKPEEPQPAAEELQLGQPEEQQLRQGQLKTKKKEEPQLVQPKLGQPKLGQQQLGQPEEPQPEEQERTKRSRRSCTWDNNSWDNRRSRS